LGDGAASPMLASDFLSGCQSVILLNPACQNLLNSQSYQMLYRSSELKEKDNNHD